MLTYPGNAGLCTRCVHARTIISDRGSTFLLCELSFSDPTFVKYPRLPVTSCPGFQKMGEHPVLDWKQGELAEGLRCYESQQFFEAHEHWESVWLKLREPEKSFLQALVQMSAAFHHLERGNSQGATSLLTRALQRLEQCGESFGGINVERVCFGIRDSLKELESGVASRDISVPKIQIRPGE